MTFIEAKLWNTSRYPHHDIQCNSSLNFQLVYFQKEKCMPWKMNAYLNDWQRVTRMRSSIIERFLAINEEWSLAPSSINKISKFLYDCPINENTDALRVSRELKNGTTTVTNGLAFEAPKTLASAKFMDFKLSKSESIAVFRRCLDPDLQSNGRASSTLRSVGVDPSSRIWKNEQRTWQIDFLCTKSSKDAWNEFHSRWRNIQYI